MNAAQEQEVLQVQTTPRLAKGVAWSGIESVAGQIISFTLFLVLARLLTPVDFGVVAVANLCVMVIQSFIYQGLGQAIVQFADLDNEHLDTVFYINLLCGGFFFILVILTAPVIGRWFHTPGLAGVLCWLSPVFVISGLTDVQNNLLVRQMNFRALALRTLLSYLAGGIVGVVMAWRGAGVWSLVSQQLTIAMINFAVLWSASKWRPGLRFSLGRARTLLAFGMHLLWVDLIGLANRRSDQFFIGKYIGPLQVGFYAVGSRVSTLVGEVISRSVSRVTLSALSRLQNEPKRFNEVFLGIIEMQSAFIFPVAIGLALVAPEVVQLCFGAKWQAAIPIMQALLLACPFEAFSGAHQSALVAKGKPGWSSIITSIHAAINIIFFILAVRYGTTAVAIAFSIRAALLYPLELLILKRTIDLPIGRVLSLLIPQVVAGALMAATVMFVRSILDASSAVFFLLTAQIGAGAVSYILFLCIGNPSLIGKLKQLSGKSAPASA